MSILLTIAFLAVVAAIIRHQLTNPQEYQVIFRKKPVATPTLEQRAATATTMATIHLSAFESAASGLEQVANDLDAVRDAAAEEASRHLAIKVNADTTAFQHRAQAQKIRDLLL